MTTRTVHCGPAVALALVLLTGCGSEPAAPTGTQPSEARAAPAPAGTPATTGAPADGRPDAVAAAREFLTAADKGTPDLAKVTPAFKQLIGPPSTASDRARGYSEWAAEQWLKDALVGKVKTTAMFAVSVSPNVTLVTASDSANGRPGQVILRVTAGGPGPLVDWVHVAPQRDRFHLGGSGDKLASAFAVNAFLDALVTGQVLLAESLLTPAFKARLAPPLNDPLGYNRALLEVKLAGLRAGPRGPATEWKANGSETEVTGALIDQTGSSRPFSLKLAKGSRPGEWLVDDFDVK